LHHQRDFGVAQGKAVLAQVVRSALTMFRRLSLMATLYCYYQAPTLRRPL
jgi:hypothetical protein